MSKVHSVGGRPTSSVQEERFLFFVKIKNPAEFSMGEEDTTLQKMVDWFTSDCFKPVYETEPISKYQSNETMLEKIHKERFRQYGHVLKMINK